MRKIVMNTESPIICWQIFNPSCDHELSLTPMMTILG